MLRKLRPQSAVLARFFGGAGLEEQRWPILATSLAFEAETWSAPALSSPAFATPDQLEEELLQAIAGIAPETPLAVYELKPDFDLASPALLDAGGRAQFSRDLPAADYERLAAYLRSHSNVELRIHGTWTGGFDAALLGRFSAISALMLDTPLVRNAAELRKLHRLASFRAAVESGMSLEPLTALASLRFLELRGTSWPVQELYGFTQLEDLRLTNTPPISPASLGFKGRLRTLALRHGIYDLSQIASLPALERLELQNVRIDRLPDFSSNSGLHTLTLRDLRLVRDLTPILSARALQRLTIEAMPQLEVPDFAPLVDCAEGLGLSIEIGSKTKSREVYRMLRKGRTR